MKRKNTIMRKSINEKYILLLSHLTRGAWIEITRYYAGCSESYGCRTSHEVRGLKLQIGADFFMKYTSHLTRGAWIEIRQRGNV